MKAVANRPCKKYILSCRIHLQTIQYPSLLIQTFATPKPETLTQRVLSTYIVECGVSILGITTMIWGSIPHNST